MSAIIMMFIYLAVIIAVANIDDNENNAQFYIPMKPSFCQPVGMWNRREERELQ